MRHRDTHVASVCSASSHCDCLHVNYRRYSSSSAGGNAGSKTAAESEESIFARSWKIPAASGFALIAFLQFYHLNNPTEDERKSHPAPALQRLPGAKTAFEETMATQRQVGQQFCRDACWLLMLTLCVCLNSWHPSNCSHTALRLASGVKCTTRSCT